MDIHLEETEDSQVETEDTLEHMPEGATEEEEMGGMARGAVGREMSGANL